MKKSTLAKNEVIHLKAIISPLLAWYDQNARALPWRENRDPYRVWVSEIMLQQTQVETVKPYFTRFIEQIPNVESLAIIGEEQLLKLWEGLGYYSRVRNMQKAARVIVDNYGGVFPQSYQDLLALPGIGDYTAGAIASICFGQRVPAVDGNVLRVVARLTGCEDDVARPEVKKRMAEGLGAIYPTSRSGDFTQSLMELGATVCLPNGAPKCEACPVHFMCRAFSAGSQMLLPVKSKKKPRKKEEKTVFLLFSGDKIALRQREAKGLLGGLWEFPNVPGRLNETQALEVLAGWGLSTLSVSRGIDKKHVFTHIEWEMGSYIVVCGNMAGPFTWVTKEKLTADMALPSAFSGFLESALALPDGKAGAAMGNNRQLSLFNEEA